MTQDQYGQPRGPGYAGHGDAVPEDENEEYRTEQSKPMTAFKKVASALRGERVADREDVDEARPGHPAANRMPTGSEQATGSDVMAPATDATGANPPYVTERDEAAMADSPISQETAPRRDYWDEPDAAATRPGEPAEVTRPDGPGATDRAAMSDDTETTADYAATEPDMFGTTGRAHDQTAARPAEGQAGAATIADVPGGTTASEAPAGDYPAGDYPASGAAAGGTTVRSGGTTRADAFPADTAPADAVPADTTPADAVPSDTTPADVTRPDPDPADTTAADTAPAETTQPPDAPLAGTGAAAGAESAPTGRHAAAATPADGDLRPGEATGMLGDFSDLTYGNLIPDAEQYTAQWQQIQFRFVDDPHASVTEAADIVAQVTAKLEAAIQERQRAIEERQRAIAEHQRSLRDRWGEGTNADTETMRETLRMYKTFLDQLIGHRAG